MHGGRGAAGGLGVVIYFALLVAITIPAMKAGLGNEGILTGVIGAAIATFLLQRLFLWVRNKIASGQLSMRTLAQYGAGAGYIPQHEHLVAQYQEVLTNESVQEEERELKGTILVREAEAIPQLPAPARPVQPTRATVQFNDSLSLSPTFAHPLADFINQNVLFIGDRRSGKSNGLGRLAEQESAFLVPMVVFDTQGDYTSLAHPEFFPRGVLVGSQRMANEYKRMRVFPLNVEGAWEFGRTVVHEGLQAVVDLRYFSSKQGPFFDDPAGQIMTAIINGIDSWEREQEDHDRVSCSIYLDEAHLWVPQQTGDTTMKMSPDVYNALCAAIFSTVVRMGGKMGFGLRLATQRIVEIDKRALQSYWTFVYRQSLQNDLDRIRTTYGLSTEEVRELPKGECFIVGPEIRTRVKMYERRSPHGGHSPGIENLLAHQRRNQTHTVASVLARQGTPSQLVSTPVQVMPRQEQPEQKNTHALHEYIPFDLPEAEPLIDGDGEFDLQRAARLWNEGANSIRKLQEAMKIETYYQANKVYQTLKEHRLVVD